MVLDLTVASLDQGAGARLLSVLTSILIHLHQGETRRETSPARGNSGRDGRDPGGFTKLSHPERCCTPQNPALSQLYLRVLQVPDGRGASQPFHPQDGS